MAVLTLTHAERHRVLDWRAALSSGIVAGVTFLILEMIMVPLFLGMSAWAPPRMIAAIAMGDGVLPPEGQPATFALDVFMVAMIVHLVLSVIYAFIGGLALHRLTMGPALIVGAALGLLLYLINFFGFTAVFEWFAMARNWVSVTAHIAFGLIAAGTYKAIQNGAAGDPHHERAVAPPRAPR